MRSKFGIIQLFLFFLFITTTRVSSQTVQELRKPIMDIMLSFPSGFESIKGEPLQRTGYNNRFYANVRIPGTQYCTLDKKDKTDKLEYVATIYTNDEWSTKRVEEVYEKWKRLLGELDFNGAALKEMTTDRYSKKFGMYYKGTAWRLDTGTMGIDPKFDSFTIRLELLDLEQAGLQLQILITDN